MLTRAIVLASSLTVLGLVGCSSSEGDERAPQDEQQEQALRGKCTTIALCIQGYQWNSHKCRCEPVKAAPGACTTDADCRLYADYCTGCDCRALSNSDPDPTCSGPGVRCFVDPCMTVTAVCSNGTCVAQ